MKYIYAAVASGDLKFHLCINSEHPDFKGWVEIGRYEKFQEISSKPYVMYCLQDSASAEEEVRDLVGRYNQASLNPYPLLVDDNGVQYQIADSGFVTKSQGEYFKDTTSGEVYVLAIVGAYGERPVLPMMCLVSFAGGYYTDPVKVMAKRCVEEKEWNEITAGDAEDFVPVNVSYSVTNL